ncbi:sigma-54-dependent transcriptional regulator [Leptothrix discophora]|uniref:Sigma-54 dependent transcriptional regulator n=1 Tax=Leptothrix discophora TaxID=89 RepID=A0ABT9G7F3_LEPDI|nr:sigma-54 dependent transcriptional regulator [Leptothrix discophora]MDP4302419.1 sigma-54 dependent transcriptional regulator [Leptothrix discophora]
MARAILIIEDETTLARNLAMYLERLGDEVRIAGRAEDGLTLLETWRPDIVILDHNLPGMTGLEALTRIRAIDTDARIIMVTGYGSTELAVEAMKAGASDFMTKPLVLSELKIVLDRLSVQGKLASTVDYYAQRDAQESGLDKIVGESEPVRQLRHTIATLLDSESRLSDRDPPAVLVVGETGTGKELVARALHFGGPRRSEPFVEINCGAMPAQLIEAELFGYEKGAFTDARSRKAGLVETAESGTVFLDEIGEAELSTQVKLLKLLEEKRMRRLGGLRELQVHARVISATNRPLEQMVRDGTFRADLFFRLRIVEIRVPPLRERGSDISLLAEHFLQLHGQRYRKFGLVLGADARQALLQYSWPGNIRELRNVMEQAVLVVEGTEVGVRHLRLSGLATQMHEIPINDDDLHLERMERRLIQRALEKTKQNVSAAARLLGVSRDTLRYRLERLDMRSDDKT